MFFKDAIAVGGLTSDRYLSVEQRSLEEELRDLIDRLHDRKLREGCERVEHAYRFAFASSPPVVGPRFYMLDGSDATRYDDEDRQRAEQRARQVEHARDGLDAIEDVLARLKRLERFLPTR